MRTFDENTMIRVSDVRELAKQVPVISKSNNALRRYWLKDTSGASSSGQSYDLVIQEYAPYAFTPEFIKWDWRDIKTIASTVDTFFPDDLNNLGKKGTYSISFDLAAVEILTNSLRATRELVGISMKKAAEKSGTPYRTWQSWETVGSEGRRPPGIAFSWLILWNTMYGEKPSLQVHPSLTVADDGSLVPVPGYLDDVA